MKDDDPIESVLNHEMRSPTRIIAGNMHRIARADQLQREKTQLKKLRNGAHDNSRQLLPHDLMSISTCWGRMHVCYARWVYAPQR
jgi:hypothetical protein